MKRTIGLLLLVALGAVALGETTKTERYDCKYPDLENIGRREINGRIYLIFPNFIGYDKEIALGAEVAAQMEQNIKLLKDEAVLAYLDNVVQALVRHSDAKVPFHVKIVDSDEINAFALPGGFMYVNKGLIQAAETEDELVGVLCHEIAHVAARHATERMTKAQLMEFASIPTIFIGGVAGSMIQSGLGLAMDLKILGITRGSEKEADILGVQYAWSAGFDPEGFLTFFEKMLSMEKKQPGKLAGWFRTHPSTPDRIAVMKLMLAKCLPGREKYLVTSSGFDEVKTKLMEYDNTMAAASKKKPGQGKRSSSEKPTLKRRTDSDTGDTTDDDSGKKKEEKKKE